MKANLLTAVLSLALASPFFAASSTPVSLPDLVKHSAYIFAGDVVNIRMTDKNGREITDPGARTGPGSENTLFFEVVVDRSLILKSGDAKLPKEVSIPFDQALPLSLGESQKLLKEKTFFFLDKEFRPAHPGHFQEPLDAQKKLESILRRLH